MHLTKKRRKPEEWILYGSNNHDGAGEVAQPARICRTDGMLSADGVLEMLAGAGPMQTGSRQVVDLFGE